MTTEEGLEKGLTWREIGFLQPIAPNSSLRMNRHDVDLMQLLLNVSIELQIQLCNV